MKNLVNIVVNPQPQQVVVDQDQDPDMTKASCEFTR